MATLQIDQLRSKVRGPIVTRGDANYDVVRQVHNGMIDKRPALFVRCVDVADVMAALEYARANGLLTSIRGGGHNGGGLGLCDEGLVVDLSLMRNVRVDPEARVLEVAGGAVFGDVDHATHPFGLAVPSGIISTTGVGGLTLGGGIGYLAREYGLTIDNLLSADVVLADGTFVTADERRNPDLFWAFDGLYPPGLQWYWRADFVKELTPDAIARHAQHGAALPSMHSTMHLYAIDGAAQRVGRDETAFSYRDANWAEVIVGVDPDPANRNAITTWCKDYFDALHPYSAGGAYVNFMMDEGQERVQASFRDNYNRLSVIKAKYDPTNFFRVNQNIRPAVARVEAGR